MSIVDSLVTMRTVASHRAKPQGAAGNLTLEAGATPMHHLPKGIYPVQCVRR